MKRISVSKFNRRARQGFTFIEVLAVLSIIAVATVGLMMMRDWAVGNSRVAEAKAQLATIQSGVRLWRPRSGIYTGISVTALTDIAALPTKWATGERMNPWGGDISVTVDGADNSRYTVRYTGIMYSEEGARLAHDFAELAVVASFSDDTFTVTFQG